MFKNARRRSAFYAMPLSYGDAAAMFAIYLRSPRHSEFSFDAVRTPPAP
jgi:hypothetical protein